MYEGEHRTIGQFIKLLVVIKKVGQTSENNNKLFIGERSGRNYIQFNMQKINQDEKNRGTSYTSKMLFFSFQIR